MPLQIEKILSWFEKTALYREILSKLPEPLNNSLFSGLVVLVLTICIICSIVEHINNFRIRRRIKRKNREYEEKKIDDKLKAAEEKEQNKEMEKCIQMMMVTQMQQMQMMSEQNTSKEKEEKGPVQKEEDLPVIDHRVGVFPDVFKEQPEIYGSNPVPRKGDSDI